MSTHKHAHTHPLTHTHTHTQLEDKMKVQYLCCNHTEVKGDYNYHKGEILLEQFLWGATKKANQETAGVCLFGSAILCCG